MTKRKPSNNGPLRHSYNTITRAREGLALVFFLPILSANILQCWQKGRQKGRQIPYFFRTKKAPYGLKPAWMLNFLMELLTGFEPATY